MSCVYKRDSRSYRVLHVREDEKGIPSRVSREPPRICLVMHTNI